MLLLLTLYRNQLKIFVLADLSQMVVVKMRVVTMFLSDNFILEPRECEKKSSDD